MSGLRSRQRKRGMTRAPGIWRGRRWSADTGRPAVEHGTQHAAGLGARALSGLIVVSLIVVLSVFFVTDYFYVHNITVVGVNYLDEAEVFRYSGMEGTHIFWIDPEKVRESILRLNVVADARVEIGWPPDLVRVYIEEREPAFIWVQSGTSSLIDLQGRRLRFLAEGETPPSLLWVLTEGNAADLPSLDASIPLDVVNGVVQLQNLLMGVPSLRYDPVNGLGFQEQGGGQVWLGVGSDMLDKLPVYETLRDNLLARGITPTEINVAHLGAVYYRGAETQP